jgi:hypothetical protein
MDDFAVFARQAPLPRRWAQPAEAGPLGGAPCVRRAHDENVGRGRPDPIHQSDLPLTTGVGSYLPLRRTCTPTRTAWAITVIANTCHRSERVHHDGRSGRGGADCIQIEQEVRSR